MKGCVATRNGVEWSWASKGFPEFLLMKKLLYYAPASYGGLLNYAQEQADALAGLGIEVTVLCSPNFEKRATDRYRVLPKLVESRVASGGNKILRAIKYVRTLLKNLKTVREEAVRGGYRHVLLASYAEYFSPLWAGSYRRLAAEGITFGAVVQEPVRNFQVGPKWWHQWSVGAAYSFLKFAFVHDEVVLDTGWTMPQMETVVVPYGPHRFPDATKSREDTRRSLGIPEKALVLFSFGHIRDNKNLDYAVRAIAEIPEAYLLVAGKRSASSQRPESFYQELAEKLGVAERCKWVLEYVSEEDAANFFTASDLVLLNYSSCFRSASGVLHVAARYRKQSIVSAGQGSLQSVVRNYQIGVWVEPDEPSAVAAGIREWLKNPPVPDWGKYDIENSWEENARIVLENLEIE